MLKSNKLMFCSVLVFQCTAGLVVVGGSVDYIISTQNETNKKTNDHAKCNTMFKMK